MKMRLLTRKTSENVGRSVSGIVSPSRLLPAFARERTRPRWPAIRPEAGVRKNEISREQRGLAQRTVHQKLRVGVGYFSRVNSKPTPTRTRTF